MHGIGLVHEGRGEAPEQDIAVVLHSCKGKGGDIVAVLVQQIAGLHFLGHIVRHTQEFLFLHNDNGPGGAPGKQAAQAEQRPESHYNHIPHSS